MLYGALRSVSDMSMIVSRAMRLASNEGRGVQGWPCFTVPDFSSRALPGASIVGVVPSHAMSQPRPMAMAMDSKVMSRRCQRMLTVSATRMQLASPVITRPDLGVFRRAGVEPKP